MGMAQKAIDALPEALRTDALSALETAKAKRLDGMLAWPAPRRTSTGRNA
jgi:hypothetical protein